MSQHRADAKPHESMARITGQVVLTLWLGATCGLAQSSPPTEESLNQKVQQLTAAMDQAQKRIEQSERELNELRAQMAALQQQIANANPKEAELDASKLSAAVEEIREQQALEDSQIATHEQAKVESESKYPLKLSGLVLLTGFVNTSQVDDPVAPSMALPGGGSTGASLRQTVAGFDARGAASDGG